MKRTIRSGMAIAVALGVVALIPVLAGESQGDHVLVTKPGVVFHKVGSGDIRGRGVEKTIDGALEAGYTPCPVCFAKEIQAARTGTTAKSGAAVASYGATADGLPSPPIVTVTQPFGMRFASDHTRSPKDAVRNPYEDLTSVVQGRAEQGAYSQR
jgi:hypothetical protein